MSLILGAYAAQPAVETASFYAGLGAIDSIRGLELPFGPLGGGPWPEGAPGGFSAVVTAIPGTMQRLQCSPSFGLASADAEGRNEALAYVSELRSYVSRLEGEGHSVEAVELHSAPAYSSSASAFERSLREILEWDWGSTQVCIEHCDAPRAGHASEKGFLPLEEEMEVLSTLGASGARVGLVINWGRSVIESGDPGSVVAQLAEAREAGVLYGVMFSGCSPVETEFGYPWIDAHLPAVEVTGAPLSSLLNRHEIQKCLTAAGPVPLVGFKIGLGDPGLGVPERLQRLAQMSALTAG